MGKFRLTRIEPPAWATQPDLSITGVTVAEYAALQRHRDKLLSTISGNSANSGGGVYNDADGEIHFTNSILRGNSADFAGGLLNAGTATITDSTIADNSAGVDGGGLSNTGTATITNSTVAGNTSDRGGGITNAGVSASLTIIGSTLSGNSASINGGGFYNRFYGTANVINSTISGNSANGGGGVSNFDGTIEIANSTLSGNTANQGGGVYNMNGTVNITNSTITNNSAGVGGGINNEAGTELTLSNTIVAGNTAASGSEIRRSGGTVTADAQNLFGHNSLINAQAFAGFGPGANDITATADGAAPTALVDILDPTLADNGGPTLTHALVTDSPAIDAGSNTLANGAGLTTDQRGFTHIVDGDRTPGAVVDIGTVEYNPNFDDLIPLANNRNFFVDSRGLFENLYRRDEKWLQGDIHPDDNGGNPWYYLLPDFNNNTATLVEWSGSGLNGNVLLTLSLDAWENPELVVNASTRTPSSPAQVANADQTRQFYRSSSGNFAYNGVGGREKWLKGLISAKDVANQNNPWYYILPDGSVHEWDGTPGLSGTEVVAITPDVNLHEDPSLLTQAFQDPDVTSDDDDGTPGGNLDEALNFYFDRSGGMVRNLFENAYGQDEKWFRGDTNNFGNPWYILLPSGALLEWDGNASAGGNVLANLGPNAWNNIERVVNDFQAPLNGGTQTAIDADRDFSLFQASNDINFFFNALGEGEKWLKGRTHETEGSINNWYILTQAGDLIAWDGTAAVSGTTVTTGLASEVYVNPLLLADAFADGSVLNNPLALDPFGPNDGGPGDTLL